MIEQRPLSRLAVAGLAAGLILTVGGGPRAFAAAAEDNGPTGPPQRATAPTAPLPPLPDEAAIHWVRVYRNDFKDMTDVTRMQSAPEHNATLKPTDSTNKPLQTPTLRDNVVIEDDPRAEDGKAIVDYTRENVYELPGGATAKGWTNGRWQIASHDEPPPVRVRARLRMTPSLGAKTAVMWWPAQKGWPWEVDFGETFGGKDLTDYWGSRQHIGQRWHFDINGDGAAKEQRQHDDMVDMTKYHIFDLFITPQHMWIEIDGKKTYETIGPKWIPNTAGHFAIGKAMTGRRDAARTVDAVAVDWIEIYRPATAAAATP